MSSSYMTESEAPRDFRVSSTESDGHYTKCLLCFTVKRNFYCVDCIRNGNFVHSSMPYSERYAEKLSKLQRLKANRKYILDRCEKLLHPKLKRDRLITEAKQSRDRLDLLRLAIEQRKSNIEEKRKELTELTNNNNELKLKLPRYQKRVLALGKHSQQQCIELQNKVSTYNEKVECLASLRRSRIRQLTTYIFPVYMTYDISDSIEDMEFIGSDTEEEPPKRPQVHIVAPWINTDGDFSQINTWLREYKECVGEGAGGWARVAGALSLAAQLLALLAWTLDQRLPHALTLTEFSSWRMCESAVKSRMSRVCACTCALLAPHMHALTHTDPDLHPLVALHALTVAAATDHPELGRCVYDVGGAWADWAQQWAAEEPEDVEPEHLTWPDVGEAEECGASPPVSSSLVTSAAASLASMWRGWTK